MESRDWEGGSENDSDTATLEEPLNLSASQLVQIMNCAMKRGHGDVPGHHVVTKRRCFNTVKKSTPVGIQSCSSPSLLSGKSRQDLIQRNKYLERRVRELEQVVERAKGVEILEQRVEELEQLNALLQYGLVQSVRGAIVETLKSVIPVPEPVQHSPNVATDVGYRNRRGSDQSDATRWSRPEEVFRSSGLVTSSSDVVGDVGQNITWCGQQKVLKIKQEPEKDVTDLPSSPKVFDGPPHMLQGAYLTTMDNGCQNEVVTSSVPSVKVLGMANEIQQAVSESPNYKKLTNRLLNILFEREELACSTLTGKSKGEHAKEKLDEDTVNLIIHQAVMRFPGTSPSDVRVVISQNCKDKALRFHKSNKQQPTSFLFHPPADPPGIAFTNSGVDGIDFSPGRTLLASTKDLHQNKVVTDATSL